MKKFLLRTSIIISGLVVSFIAFAQVNGPTNPSNSFPFQPGFRLIDGSALQLMLNNLVNLTNYQYKLVTASTDTTIVANNIGNVLFDVGGGANSVITNETVTTPPQPFDGQQLRIGANRTITTFAIVANTGQSLGASTPTTLTASTTASQGYTWIFRAANTTWYRLE
jgi:hypothetical protein